MSAQNNGAKTGERVDNVSDKVKNTSWRDVGATGGKKLDEVRNTLNEKYVDSNGKTPEDHFRELYGASANLVGHTIDYAWSWVPFTKQKAQEAKRAAQEKDLSQLKEDAKTKGIEFKEDALKTELPGDTQQTLGGLIDESRALVGQVLNTAVYYIRVGEEKAESAAGQAKGTAQDAASDAKGTAKSYERRASAKSQSYIDQARNLTAYLLERSQDIITYGQQKANEAKENAKDAAGQAEGKAKNVKDNAQAKAQVNGGDRPGFSIQANL